MATYKLVPEHDGIEIYFDVKPAAQVLEELRSNGWRWHRNKECWFTKKSATAENLARKLCNQPQRHSLPERSNTVTIQQSAGNVYISTLTIYNDGHGYSISSTNNQVVCCDCNSFFSVHAVACPFCGCPINYVAECYFKKFDPVVLQREAEEDARKRKEEQKRIRKEEEKKEQDKIIDAIVQYRYRSWEVGWRLRELRKSALEKAKKRADTLERIKAPISISDKTYVELLSGSDINFKKALLRVTLISARRERLPVISEKVWTHLMSIDDKELNMQISNLEEKYKAEQERTTAIVEKQKEEERNRKEKELKIMCGRYKITPEQLSVMIEKYGSKEIVFQKLCVIDDLGGEYRHKIDLLKYIDSPDSVENIVKGLK